MLLLLERQLRSMLERFVLLNSLFLSLVPPKSPVGGLVRTIFSKYFLIYKFLFIISPHPEDFGGVNQANKINNYLTI